MITIRDKTTCCGCSACAQVCSRNAISMVADRVGFSYPKVDRSLCVECGRCDDVCPMRKGAFERTPSHVFALKHLDVKLRRSSASGGAFSVLAERILNQHGVVYGAAFNKEWGVEHVRIERLSELPRLRGSKYVQSRIGQIYSQVRGDLKAGRYVLFSGLPCQVAGLNMYIGYTSKLRERLITVELVCGNVSNPRVWIEYLDEVCKAHRVDRSKITAINFRDKKDEGWRRSHLSIELAGERVLSELCWRNAYMMLFLKDFINRPSCKCCHFRGGRSGATYTIADYWGVDFSHPDIFDDCGVSLLLQYGDENLLWMREHAEVTETGFQEACFSNPCIKKTILKGRYFNLFYFIHDGLGLSITRSLRMSLPFAALEDRIANRIRRLLARLRKG